MGAQSCAPCAPAEGGGRASFLFLWVEGGGRGPGAGAPEASGKWFWCQLPNIHLDKGETELFLGKVVKKICNEYT